MIVNWIFQWWQQMKWSTKICRVKMSWKYLISFLFFCDTKARIGYHCKNYFHYPLLQLLIENSLIIKISLTTFNSSNSSISSINLQGETKHHQLHLLISDFTNLLALEFLSTFELFNPLVPDKKLHENFQDFALSGALTVNYSDVSLLLRPPALSQPLWNCA